MLTQFVRTDTNLASTLKFVDALYLEINRQRDRVYDAVTRCL